MVIIPDTYTGQPMRLDVVLHGRNARLNEVSFLADAEFGQQVGAPVEIRFPSLPGSTVTGKLDYLYPELNAETRTVKARVTLTDPPATIRPNMLASVSVGGGEGAEVVNIPRSALIRSGREERVVIALGEGRYVARRVRAGEESGDRVAIREGLQAGERVVVAGQFLLDSEANLRSGLDRLQD